MDAARRTVKVSQHVEVFRAVSRGTRARWGWDGGGCSLHTVLTRASAPPWDGAEKQRSEGRYSGTAATERGGGRAAMHGSAGRGRPRAV